MKMLGQDVLMQEEFDKFVAEQHEPFKSQCEKLQRQVNFQQTEIDKLKKKDVGFKIAVVVALVASLVAIALTML